MHMQVIHRLTAISADVHNETVATFGDALLDGDLRGGRDERAHSRTVRGGQIANRWNVPPREQEYVRGGLGRDVANGDDRLIRVDLRSRQFAADDATEEAIG
jgi:hypothetical protein